MTTASDYQWFDPSQEASETKHSSYSHSDYSQHHSAYDDWEEKPLSKEELREMNEWKEKAARELKAMHERVRKEDEHYGMVSNAPDPSEYHNLVFGWRDLREQAAVRSRIREHVMSSAYQKRVASIVKANTTGLLIPAGGAQLVANLLVTLRVVRHHFKSSIPIEVMWQAEDEMDDLSWNHIEQDFGPIRGVDISRTPHPVPNLHSKNITLRKYTGKVYSLLLSNFRYVLMVDADCMPTQDPSIYFQNPEFVSHGNLFWPDAWRDTVKGEAYESVGLKYHEARDAISAGKGFLPHDTESGQLLLDRARHLDVLEYLLWINGEREGGESLWGDKDTFGLSFASAGKAHVYAQVKVPPSGLFSWRRDMLLEKDTEKKFWGWQLLGFLQHDSLGRHAFIHRTINKFHPEGSPWKLELISAPMPIRWVEYFLAHENVGPTRGVPYDYVTPSSSFSILAPIPQAEDDEGGDLIVDECPIFSYTALWTLVESGLPVQIPERMNRSCAPTLKSLLGESYETYLSKGWIENPQMKYLDGPHLSTEVVLTRNNPLHSAPIPAYSPEDMDPSDPFLAVVRASYDAFSLIKSNMDRYPILKRKPPTDKPSYSKTDDS